MYRLCPAIAIAAIALYTGACNSTPTPRAPDPQVVRRPDGSLAYQSEVAEGLGVAVDVVLDNSGSMAKTVRGDDRPKYRVARAALERMLDATDAAMVKRPDLPVKIAIHYFDSKVRTVLPMQLYQRDSVRAALGRIPLPIGGTAIGVAMDSARRELYRSGVFRKNIIVVTDGENTNGRPPDEVARETFDLSEGAVGLYFVAFDVGRSNFGFVNEVGGHLVEAANGSALATSLDRLYRGTVLAEALDTMSSTHLAPSPTVNSVAGKHRP